MSDLDVSAFPRRENIDETLATTDVDATALLVHENIVSIAAGIGSAQHCAVANVERGKFRWASKHDQHPLVRRIDGKREILAQRLRRPARGLFVRGAIDDCDLVRSGNVDKDSPAARLQLEALGVRFQGDGRDLPAADRVDHRKRAAPVSGKHALSRTIDAHIVGIVPELDCARGREVCAVQEAHGAIAPVGYINGVGGCLVRNALRFMKTAERANHRALLEIYDTDTVIAEFRHVQTLAAGIERQVIDAALHVSEDDLVFESQRFGLGAGAAAAPRCESEEREESESSDAGPGVHPGHGPRFTFA
jgi:hypothetical protein